MLAGPHERTLEEAISNLDEMLKLMLNLPSLQYFLLTLGQILLPMEPKGLYPADCWDRLMKDPLCGVEFLFAGKNIYLKQKYWNS